MFAFRLLLLRHRGLAAGILALALAMKLLLPGGFMPALAGDRIVVSICSGSGPATMVMTLPTPDHGTPGDDGRHGKADAPCAFAGLSAPSLAAAGPALLVAAIRYVMARGLHQAISFDTTPAPYLRPPLRGPPTLS